MTRKRFVKLLMSRGYSRNEANSKAQAAVSAGVTYDGAYFSVRVEAGDSELLEALYAVCDRIAAALRSVAAAAVKVAQSFSACLTAAALGVDLKEKMMVDVERDQMAEIMERLADLNEQWAKSEFSMAELGCDPVDTPMTQKAPRPPKCLGPVNKANYTANRPPRVARSSCRTSKR